MPELVAIVTGASQGIGQATAVRLAKDFSGVILSARDRDALQEVEAEVKSSGADPLTVALDLRTRESADIMMSNQKCISVCSSNVALLAHRRLRL